MTTTSRTTRRLRQHPGHGPRCASDPEVGCVCGKAEEDAERLAPCCYCGCVRARRCDTPQCSCHLALARELAS